MSEPYQLGKTGLHTIPQLRRHIQVYLEQESLDATTWQNVIIMQLLLNLYDKLEEISADLSDIATDSHNDHHNK